MSRLSDLEEKLGKELIYAIGVLFVSAGAVEHALALHLARLIAHPHKLDPATVAALAGTETKVRLQQIQIMARFRLSSEKTEDVVKLCDKIRDSFGRRNELAHFVVMPGKTANKAVLRAIRIKADGSLAPEKPYTAEQIMQFAEKLAERMSELDRLLTESGVARLDEADSQELSIGIG